MSWCLVGLDRFDGWSVPVGFVRVGDCDRFLIARENDPDGPRFRLTAQVVERASRW